MSLTFPSPQTTIDDPAGKLASLVDRLPLELLLEAITIAVRDHAIDLRTLVQISQRWRHLIFASPRLWTHIHLRSTLHWIKLVVKRSIALPLRITLVGFSENDLATTQRLERIWGVIVPNLFRVWEVALEEVGFGEEIMCHGMPSLRSLSFTGALNQNSWESDSHDLSLLFLKSSKANIEHVVVIRGAPLSVLIQRRWALRSLTISEMTVSITRMLNILAEHPTLEKLDLRGLDLLKTCMRKHIQLPALTDLVVHGTRSDLTSLVYDIDPPPHLRKLDLRFINPVFKDFPWASKAVRPLLLLGGSDVKITLGQSAVSCTCDGLRLDITTSVPFDALAVMASIVSDELVGSLQVPLITKDALLQAGLETEWKEDGLIPGGVKLEPNTPIPALEWQQWLRLEGESDRL